MKMRSLALAVLTLAALAASAPPEKDKQKPKAVVYKTPQAVFDAVEKAMAGDDFDTYVGCYSPTVQAGFVCLFASILADARTEEMNEVRRREQAVRRDAGPARADRQGVGQDPEGRRRGLRKGQQGHRGAVKDHPASSSTP